MLVLLEWLLFMLKRAHKGDCINYHALLQPKFSGKGERFRIIIITIIIILFCNHAF